MARTIHSKSIHENREARPRYDSLDPEDLKNLVRDQLLLMSKTDREVFVEILEIEMERADFSMRSYLIPLGIPGRTPDELTPTEIGHLVRFLKINVPRAMPAVQRAMARLSAFAESQSASDRRLAA